MTVYPDIAPTAANQYWNASDGQLATYENAIWVSIDAGGGQFRYTPKPTSTASATTSPADQLRLSEIESVISAQQSTVAEEKLKVEALEEDKLKSRVFMRAGAGNTSRYVYQNTVDGTESGTPLIAEYTAIAAASATASDLELLLTDEASAGKFHLEGNHFAFDYLFAHHYRPHHIINAAGLLYRTREAATLDQLQLDPADTTSGYIQL